MIRFSPFVLCVLSLVLFASSARAQTTALFYTSQAGSPLASGQTATITSSDATFSQNTIGPSVEFFINGAAAGVNSVTLVGTGVGPLTVGTYESACDDRRRRDETIFIIPVTLSPPAP
jgi:hypothetical protein